LVLASLIIPISAGIVAATITGVIREIRKDKSQETRFAQPNIGTFVEAILTSVPFTGEWSARTAGVTQENSVPYQAVKHFVYNCTRFFSKGDNQPMVYTIDGTTEAYPIARNQLKFLESLITGGYFRKIPMMQDGTRLSILMKDFLDFSMRFISGYPGKEGVPVGAKEIQEATKGIEVRQSGLFATPFNIVKKGFDRLIVSGGAVTFAGIFASLGAYSYAIKGLTPVTSQIILSFANLFISDPVILEKALVVSESGSTWQALLAGGIVFFTFTTLGAIKWGEQYNKRTFGQMLGETLNIVRGREFKINEGDTKRPDVSPGTNTLITLIEKTPL
jgi:hypothetical protein